jgi:hypothetical protein
VLECGYRRVSTSSEGGPHHCVRLYHSTQCQHVTLMVKDSRKTLTKTVNSNVCSKTCLDQAEVLHVDLFVEVRVHASSAAGLAQLADNRLQRSSPSTSSHLTDTLWRAGCRFVREICRARRRSSYWMWLDHLIGMNGICSDAEKQAHVLRHRHTLS